MKFEFEIFIIILQEENDYLNGQTRRISGIATITTITSRINPIRQ